MPTSSNFTSSDTLVKPTGTTTEPPVIKSAHATDDPQHLAFLKEKFGGKYQSIVDRYGAIDTVYDDDVSALFPCCERIFFGF